MQPGRIAGHRREGQRTCRPIVARDLAGMTRQTPRIFRWYRISGIVQCSRDYWHLSACSM
jgi:hypothetical protein